MSDQTCAKIANTVQTSSITIGLCVFNTISNLFKSIFNGRSVPVWSAWWHIDARLFALCFQFIVKPMFTVYISDFKIPVVSTHPINRSLPGLGGAICSPYASALCSLKSITRLWTATRKPIATTPPIGKQIYGNDEYMGTLGIQRFVTSSNQHDTYLPHLNRNADVQKICELRRQPFDVQHKCR